MLMHLIGFYQNSKDFIETKVTLNSESKKLWRLKFSTISFIKTINNNLNFVCLENQGVAQQLYLT